MFGSVVNSKGKTEKNKHVKEGPCLFPFTYKWREHDSCLSTPKGNICATSLTNPKRRTLKTYGYCKRKMTLNKKTLKVIKKFKKLRGQKITVRKVSLKKIDKGKNRKVKPLNKMSKKGLNDSLLDMLSKLEELMKLKGEPFRARAYHNASESIMLYQKPIANIKELEGLPGIGKTIMSKFNEYVETGKLKT